MDWRAKNKIQNKSSQKKWLFTDRSGCTWSYSASSSFGLLRCCCILSIFFLKRKLKLLRGSRIFLYPLNSTHKDKLATATHQVLSSTASSAWTYLLKMTFYLFLWSPYGIGQTIIFSSCRLLYLSIFSFPRLISAITDWMSAILPHMVRP